MTVPQIHAQREWLVGGYEVPHDQDDQWLRWRNIRIAIQLEKEVRAALNECLRVCEELLGPESRDAFTARLLIDEAAVNMYGHGKKGSPLNPSRIAFKAEVSDHDAQEFHFELSMHDDQPEFDISALPDPTFDENLEEVTGRGILLIRTLCRARINQVPHEAGGKHMVYRWRYPAYSLMDVGLPEGPVEPHAPGGAE